MCWVPVQTLLFKKYISQEINMYVIINEVTSKWLHGAAFVICWKALVYPTNIPPVVAVGYCEHATKSSDVTKENLLKS